MISISPRIRLIALGIYTSLPAVLFAADPAKPITSADCTAVHLGSEIPVASIGEPVSGVRLSPPVWIGASAAVPAHCSIDGDLLPVSKGPYAQPIHFRVMLPAAWQQISIQFGGGGINGVLPRLDGNPAGGLTNAIADGAATYGSDSGHTNADPHWSLDDEAIQNLSYAQMKKTHDAAIVLIQRMYGEKPRFNYYAGNSQGGREGLTVAQRYPADYDGVSAGVPIVNFSALMLGPVLIREQEKQLKDWVPPTKGGAITAEFMRQCDGLDGLQDGVIANYQACRAIFDQTEHPAAKSPWTGKLCPGDIDPNPADDSANACLTLAQAKTLDFIFSRFVFPHPRANGVASFGMWTPTTAVAPSKATGGMPLPPGGLLLVSQRFKGQQGASPDAPAFTHLGILGSIGFVQQDLSANPLDYVEGGPNESRRLQISQWMDATSPDLSAFHKRGGKLLMEIGTDDVIASPGAQLDYYQSLLDKLGRATLDTFVRMWVLPQASHGLEAHTFEVDGKGEAVPPRELPNRFDRFAALRAWVEQDIPPLKSEVVRGKDGSFPLCSYPAYPRYSGGDPNLNESYRCTNP